MHSIDYFDETWVEPGEKNLPNRNWAEAKRSPPYAGSSGVFAGSDCMLSVVSVGIASTSVWKTNGHVSLHHPRQAQKESCYELMNWSILHSGTIPALKHPTTVENMPNGSPRGVENNAEESGSARDDVLSSLATIPEEVAPIDDSQQGMRLPGTLMVKTCGDQEEEVH
jgi:hypothetical protein